MTKKDILDIAREAGFGAGECCIWTDHLIKFAELVDKKSREECAEICDKLMPNGEHMMNDEQLSYWEAATIACGDAISKTIDDKNA